MFRLLPTAARRVAHCSKTAPRAFSTVGTAFTASDAAELSGYNKIDFCIDEDAPVIEAVKTFVAHNIGCLVTTNRNGKLVIGMHLKVVSKRNHSLIPASPFSSAIHSR